MPQILSLTSQSASRQQLGRRAALPRRQADVLNDCPRLCQAPCKDHLSRCWIFFFSPPCQIVTALPAAQLVKSLYFAISFLCHVSALKSPVSFPPPSLPSLWPCFPQNAFPSRAWHRPAFQEPPKNRGQGTELLGWGGGNRQRRREMERHTEAKQT